METRSLDQNGNFHFFFLCANEQALARKFSFYFVVFFGLARCKWRWLIGCRNSFARGRLHTHIDGEWKKKRVNKWADTHVCRYLYIYPTHIYIYLDIKIVYKSVAVYIFRHAITINSCVLRWLALSTLTISRTHKHSHAVKNLQTTLISLSSRKKEKKNCEKHNKSVAWKITLTADLKRAYTQQNRQENTLHSRATRALC